MGLSNLLGDLSQEPPSNQHPIIKKHPRTQTIAAPQTTATNHNATMHTHAHTNTHTHTHTCTHSRHTPAFDSHTGISGRVGGHACRSIDTATWDEQPTTFKQPALARKRRATSNEQPSRIQQTSINTFKSTRSHTMANKHNVRMHTYVHKYNRAHAHTFDSQACSSGRQGGLAVQSPRKRPLDASNQDFKQPPLERTR